MSKTLRISLIVIIGIIGAAALVLVGMSFGRAWWSPMGYWPGNIMAGYGSSDETLFPHPMRTGMLGHGMMGPGMMGAYGYNRSRDVEPLSLSEAEGALEDYLNTIDSDDLFIGEIMIFDNHAYAQFVEKSTGIGAMEVLVNPATRIVSPEFGPNMMWNLKYSPMAGMGMMGGRGYTFQHGGMGGTMSGQITEIQPSEMPVTPDEAVQIAQRHLDSFMPGTNADETPDPFYGYYTLHIEDDGATVGMLSVHGYSGEVFIHTWHGDLIEMSDTH